MYFAEMFLRQLESNVCYLTVIIWEKLLHCILPYIQKQQAFNQHLSDITEGYRNQYHHQAYLVLTKMPNLLLMFLNERFRWIFFCFFPFFLINETLVNRISTLMKHPIYHNILMKESYMGKLSSFKSHLSMETMQSTKKSKKQKPNPDQT